MTLNWISCFADRQKRSQLCFISSSKSSNPKIPRLFLFPQSLFKINFFFLICFFRYHVDLLTLILNEFSLPNVGIYGKMDQLTRKENLSLLRSQKVKIMIVTDLAARGLDIPFVVKKKKNLLLFYFHHFLKN